MLDENVVTLTHFINTDYKEYSKYVLESRAIPSVVDGLKPSQRKVLYTAIKECRTKKIKTASLAGATVALANYHHGAASLEGAISLMAPDWANNAPLLEGEGNFGSRLVNDASAPRYTFVKLNQNYNKYFIDNDVIENDSTYLSYDPEDPEPKYYLPIIPWVLVNGIKGIAIGYSTNILPRKPENLAKACIQYLTKGKIDEDLLHPHWPQFKGEILQDEEGKYYARGTFNRKGKTHLTITEIPPDVERESYVEHLQTLEDNGKIVSFTDKCSKEGFCFDIVLPRGEEIEDERLYRLLKLEKGFSENLTTIDENRCLKIFNSAAEIVKHFCDFRLKQYDNRYVWYIKRDSEIIHRLSAKLTFVRAVVNGKIKFKGKSKKEILTEMTDLCINPKYHDMCIGVPAYSFCDDYIQDLEKEITDLRNAVAHWNECAADTKHQFVKDLKAT